MFTFSKNFGLAAAIDARTERNLRMLRMYVDDSCITALRQEVATIDQLRDKGTTELKPEDFAKAFGLPAPVVHNIVIYIPKDEESDDKDKAADDVNKDQAESGHHGGRRRKNEDQEKQICDRREKKKPEMIQIPYPFEAVDKSRLMSMIKMAYQAKHDYNMSDHVAGKISGRIQSRIKNTSNRTLMRDIAELLAKEEILG